MWLGLVSPDHFQEMIVSGRMFAAMLSLGSIYLTGRLASYLGLSKWASYLAAFLMAVFPLSVQLSQYSTVDAHLTFFSLLSFERAFAYRSHHTWKNIICLGASLGAALACKITAIPLPLMIFIFLWPLRKNTHFWTLPLVTLLCFFTMQPYALLDWFNFSREIQEQIQWARGINPPIFFHQYENTLKYLYSIKNLFAYSVGSASFVLACYGIITSKKNQNQFLILGWLLWNVVMLGASYAKFSRYWLPLLPIFAIYTSFGFESLKRHLPRWLNRTVIGIFVAFSALTGVATHTIHLQKHPYRKASEWLDNDAAPQKDIHILLDSVWVGFPPVGTKLGSRHTKVNYAELFGLMNDSTYVDRISNKLFEAEYFITLNHMSIRTAYEQIYRKPIQAKTFDALLNGTLGYKLSKVVTTQPMFLKKILNDFSLDPSIAIYDHPTLFIWKNQRHFSAGMIKENILDTFVQSPSSSLKTYESFATDSINANELGSLKQKDILPIRTESAQDRQILDGKWWHPVIWILFFMLSGIAGWPLANKVIPNSSGQGYGTSKLLVWIVFAYVLWCIGHLPYQLLSQTIVGILWVALLMFGGFTWLRTNFTCQIKSWDTMKEVLIVEGITLMVFVIFYLFRLFAPDIYWSENPIDLSYLALLTKSLTMPPVDPGYSGTTLNYYYYGFYLFALPAKILGIPPNISYGLSMATVPALMGGLVFTLSSSFVKRPYQIMCGLMSVILTLFIGNLDGVIQFIEKGGVNGFNFFRSAHEVIPFTVHEFPLWSYLFVDLHAHLISGLLFVLFLCWMRFVDLSKIKKSQLAIGAVILGSMGPSSTWDYFTCVMLVLLSATYYYYKTRKLDQIRPSMVLIIGSYLLFLPFYLIFTKKMAKLGVGFVGDQMTNLYSSIVCFGIFLPFVLAESFREIGVRVKSKQYKLLVLIFSIILSMVLILFLSFSRIPGTFLLYGFCSVGVLLALLNQQKSQYLSARGLIFYAMIILCMCEVFFIRDWLQGGEWKRMNTVFKFYYQVWFMFALALPCIALDVYQRIRTVKEKKLFCVLCVVLLICGLLWPLGAWRSRVIDHSFQRQGRFDVTMNGLDWLKHLRPHEYRTVAWLWQNGKTDDVILEAGHHDYQYEYNVVSSASGVPTVQSWWSHTEQRDRPYYKRSMDVREFYQTQDINRAIQILRDYHVTYVYVAEREREQYGIQGLSKFTTSSKLFEPVLVDPLGNLYRVIY
ncbi:MAG: glycosyltransferase family 39 protein [Bdellovibrionales bacterium]|nr:glycosyltransferase family 39 protein [Bdellovibrionales bacterium]